MGSFEFEFLKQKSDLRFNYLDARISILEEKIRELEEKKGDK